MSVTNELMYETSLQKYALWLIVSFLFTIVGIVVFINEGGFMPIFCMLFFGFSSIVFTYVLINPPYLRLTPQGFSSTSWGKEYTIAWNDVAKFDIVLAAKNIKYGVTSTAVAFQLKPGVSSPFPKTSAIFKLKFDGFDGALTGTPFGISDEELFRALNEWKLRYGNPS